MLTRNGEDGVLEIALSLKDFTMLALQEGSVQCSLNGSSNTVTVHRTNFCTEGPRITDVHGNILVDFPIHYRNPGEITSIRGNTYEVLNGNHAPTGKSVRFSYSNPDLA